MMVMMSFRPSTMRSELPTSIGPAISSAPYSAWSFDDYDKIWTQILDNVVRSSKQGLSRILPDSLMPEDVRHTVERNVRRRRIPTGLSQRRLGVISPKSASGIRLRDPTSSLWFGVELPT